MIQFSTSAASAGAEITAERMAEHEGLVRWVVRQQGLGGMPFEDGVHEGRIGLWQALKGYDPARGTTFSTYAVPAITHAVWRAVALHLRHSAPFPSPCVEQLSVDLADDWLEMIDRPQVYVVLAQMVAGLPPRLRQVIVAHYGLHETPPQSFAALGATLGLTRQRVQQLHVEAILWLAHPAHSWNLRRLLGRHHRADCLKALARGRRLRRKRRQPGQYRSTARPTRGG